jgi:hypothetical protein
LNVIKIALEQEDRHPKALDTDSSWFHAYGTKTHSEYFEKCADKMEDILENVRCEKRQRNKEIEKGTRKRTSK